MRNFTKLDLLGNIHRCFSFSITGNFLINQASYFHLIEDNGLWKAELLFRVPVVVVYVKYFNFK